MKKQKNHLLINKDKVAKDLKNLCNKSENEDVFEHQKMNYMLDMMRYIIKLYEYEDKKYDLYNIMMNVAMLLGMDYDLNTHNKLLLNVSYKNDKEDIKKPPKNGDEICPSLINKFFAAGHFIPSKIFNKSINDDSV